MRLDELRTLALRLVVAGDLARALRLYGHIVEAVPADLDARMKLADLFVHLGHPAEAKRVYAALAFHDLSAGRPLHAVVAGRALHDLGEPVVTLFDSLAALYGAGSPRLARGRAGARLAPPDPALDLTPPGDLDALPGLEVLIRRAAEVAASTASLADLPELFPPVPLLSELSPEVFARVLEAVVVRRLPHGTPVVRQGEPGHAFYLVAAGRVRVFTVDAAGERHDLARLGEGAVFGELALVAAQPRAASVEVDGEADLLELGAEALRAAAGELLPLAEALSRFTRDRLLKNLLATSPLFRPFSPEQRLDLARRFTGHEVGPGTVIVREGDAAHGLYVVLAGEVEVVKGDEPFERVLATLRSGELFGEIALLRGGAATATVRAARPSTVLFLAREYFERLVGALPELRAFFEQLSEERLALSRQILEEPVEVADDERVLV
jgi:CRP-like cAMP-binding protein